jgi:hypothetical protein
MLLPAPPFYKINSPDKLKINSLPILDECTPSILLITFLESYKKKIFLPLVIVASKWSYSDRKNIPNDDK